MLFIVGGASGSGKSSALSNLSDSWVDVVVRDEDTFGYHPDFDSRWRHATTQTCLIEAVIHQEHGRDMILGGQLPLGEVLACPAAAELDGIVPCMLICSDEERNARLRQRTGQGATQTQLEWARWLEGHARSPHHERDWMRQFNTPTMQWARWWDWPAGDKRWAIEVFDTTGQSVAAVTQTLVDWMERSRQKRAAGLLPLSRGWSGSFG